MFLRLINIYSEEHESLAYFIHTNCFLFIFLECVLVCIYILTCICISSTEMMRSLFDETFDLKTAVHVKLLWSRIWRSLYMKNCYEECLNVQSFAFWKFENCFCFTCDCRSQPVLIIVAHDTLAIISCSPRQTYIYPMKSTQSAFGENVKGDCYLASVRERKRTYF